MDLEIPRNIIFAIIFIPSVVLFAITPLVYSKIVTPLDMLFRGKGLTFEEGLWHVSIAIRMSQYILCIVFPQRSKKDKYAKLVYQGYDFRGNASKQEVLLSYIYLTCLIVIFVMGALLILYDFVIRPILE